MQHHLYLIIKSQEVGNDMETDLIINSSEVKNLIDREFKVNEKMWRQNIGYFLLTSIFSFVAFSGLSLIFNLKPKEVSTTFFFLGLAILSLIFSAFVTKFLNSNRVHNVSIEAYMKVRNDELKTINEKLDIICSKIRLNNLYEKSTREVETHNIE